LAQKKIGVSAGETDRPEISAGGVVLSTTGSLDRFADGTRGDFNRA
jgi:hypothetical protein